MDAYGNLPQDIATFVGRDNELTKACRLLSHIRLLTLTGPGGVGKTRLAVQVANRLRASSLGGVWMIDLQSLHDPEQCTPDRLYAHMALTMGIRHHGPAGLEVLLEHLRTRPAILLLDNCEHVIPAARQCVTALLRATPPQVRVLATSRQVLAVDGEHTLVVPPLSENEAVTLLTAHAAAAGADAAAFDDHDALVELCQRLDGLPLAIRLAAARLRTLSVAQLLRRLDDRFRLLTDTAVLDGADTLEPHGTLERVVTWSYELCTRAEQQVWCRAAVFAQAFDLSSAEAVCGGDGIDPADVIDIVAALVDKSVFAVDSSGTGPRYYLIDTLRDYGLRRLADAGEMQRMRDRHRGYYRTLVARAAAAWFGLEELDCMTTVYRQLPDILAAIDESISQHDLSAARAICRDLVRVRAVFFFGFLDLVNTRLRRVLDATDPTSINSVDEAVDVSSTAALAAWVAATQGRHTTAQKLLTFARELERRWCLAPTAPVLFAEGGSEALGAGSRRAISLLAQARSAFSDADTTGDRHMATMVWAMASAFAGEPQEAVQASDEYLRQAYNARAEWAISWALWTAALAALTNGNHSRAAECIGECLRLQRQMNDMWGQTWSIELSAWIIAAGLAQSQDPPNDARRAAWLLGAAQARQQELGVTLSGLRPLADRHAHAYRAITEALDEVVTAAAVAAGARGHARAVQTALGEPTPRRPSASGLGGLTQRERQIADLVAKGRTSRQISAELLIDRRTVDNHVAAILRKLDLRRRTALVRWWATHGDAR